MNATAYVKLGCGAFIVLVWAGLLAFKVQGAEQLISLLQLGLAGLGGYHMGDSSGDGK